MKFGVSIPNYGQWADPVAVRDATQEAEDLGYETAWFSDHIVVPPYAVSESAEAWLEPLTSISVLAGATSRIRLGTDVLVLPYRHPVALSQMVAALDCLSGGRIVLGTGVGWTSEEFQAVGAPPYSERGNVTDEYLAVLRLLWENHGPQSFEGKWVSFRNMFAEPKPLQSPFPLWIGGNGKSARRRASLFGNGWHPLFPTPERYAAGKREILALRQKEGLPDNFRFSYSCSSTQVLSSPQSSTPLDTVPSIARSREFNYRPPEPTTTDGRPLFVGTPDELLKSFHTLERAGVDHAVLRFFDGARQTPQVFEAQLKIFAEQVMAVYDEVEL